MERVKKIVFTVTNDLNFDQRMQRICTTLSEAGYLITLVGFVKSNSIALQPRIFAQVRLNVWFKTGKLFFMEYNIRLFFWLLIRKFNMYCAIDLDTILPVFLNSVLKQKPCIYDAHEYYEELPEVVDRPIIQKFWKLVARCTLPFIKFNYTVSNSIAHALSVKYHQPYIAIRNVPFLNNASAIAGEKKKIILYQGAINKGRGLEELIDAMEYVDAHLLIVGEGDLTAEIKLKAKSKFYSNKIEFAGLLTPEQLKKITSDAMIGINLIAPLGLSYYYSLSNKFFDYIHAGIPQVSMNYPEYAGINNHYCVAVLIDNLQKSAIAGALNQLLTDESLYSRMVHNTSIAKMEFNWNREKEKLIEFYKHVR